MTDFVDSNIFIKNNKNISNKNNKSLSITEDKMINDALMTIGKKSNNSKTKI
jgi:hypothetical protein